MTISNVTNQHDWSGWDECPFGLIEITCQKLINKRRPRMSLDSFNEYLDKKVGSFEKFKDDFNHLVHNIKEAQNERGINLVQMNGWQRFDNEPNPHYFMTCEQENYEIIKDVIENNIDNVEIRDNIDNRGRAQINCYMMT